MIMITIVIVTIILFLQSR